MTHTPTPRARLAATGGAVSLVLVASVLFGQAQMSEARTSLAVGGHSEQAASGRAITGRELRLHDHMRKLWEQHVAWTRMAIVTFADGSAGFDATAQRLLRNQEDIGDAFATFYGTKKGHHLASLLHDHITIAVELLQDAKAGDQAAFDAANTRWYANANDIADFLSAANPRFWPRATMRAAMKTHLDQTLAEAVAELGADYPASVANYEAIHLHILDMADLLSSGIMRQFPRRF